MITKICRGDRPRSPAIRTKTTFVGADPRVRPPLTLMLTLMFIAALAVILTGCNDVNINTSKGGPAEDFLKAFNDDNPIIPKYALSARTSHGDRGVVTITPLNADSLYDEGSQVTLEAAPAPSSIYVFAGWSGTEGFEESVNPVTQITMNANRIITANFAPHPIIRGAGDDAWAWISAEGTVGLIFYENGKYVMVTGGSGNWSAAGGCASWSVTGAASGTLYLGNDDSEWYNYAITGEGGILTTDYHGHGAANRTVYMKGPINNNIGGCQ